ncbi:GNAT family N-acetyltransferase [Hymenobacter sp. BT491]|uniref:GNAT family N-acetyltransferase n=1 Tax=Hymenobacter sp. BT491 TaxID=2766779 RepID=UPI0016536FAC|nr:GNAT family N-acetyltransferase [Hymenobacter sp. BT491]MBC6989595.1 GNAT family N-acetyltransferase [Hymenobacter sp. BT491]
MLSVSLASSNDDLRGILALQQQNLPRVLAPEVRAQEGFVTLEYTFEQMQRMHQAGPSVIALDGTRVVGYAITALPEVRAHVPELESLFAFADALPYHGTPLKQQAYYLMGQVCIAQGYRGQGVFDRLYQHHRAVYGGRYDFLLTDISLRNPRSLRAHQRLGFQAVGQMQTPVTGEQWAVVLWDWQNPAPAHPQTELAN